MLYNLTVRTKCMPVSVLLGLTENNIKLPQTLPEEYKNFSRQFWVTQQGDTKMNMKEENTKTRDKRI